MTSCKEGAHDADSDSSLCAHMETKCETVEIELLDCFLVKQNILACNLYYLAYGYWKHTSQVLFQNNCSLRPEKEKFHCQNLKIATLLCLTKNVLNLSYLTLEVVEFLVCLGRHRHSND